MTVVTLAEAQANLADLLRRAATGEQIAIEHDGARLALSVARLPTPEEEAETQRRAANEAAEKQRRALAAVRATLRDMIMAGCPLPADVDEYLKEDRAA